MALRGLRGRVVGVGALVVPVLGVLVLGACGSSSSSGGSTSTSSSTRAGPTTSTTSVTAYVDATAEVRALVPGIRGEDVAELTERIAAAFRMEEGRQVSVVSLEQGEPSIAVIAVRGAADDSVAGADYRITYEGDEAGWAVASAEKRYVCWRGVAGDTCV